MMRPVETPRERIKAIMEMARPAMGSPPLIDRRLRMRIASGGRYHRRLNLPLMVDFVVMSPEKLLEFSIHG